uniref:ATP synthase F0 subunit 8 n=1 Tax=Paravarcia deceptrix TaxID=1200249 RepID=UPI002A7F20BD|nr:ATP synthase F0 subunit 8 [Paravarcia deceptrix]WOW99103.1 ATP synthase F0 subunit 8 [Paravarcia deceptrix]
MPQMSPIMWTFIIMMTTCAIIQMNSFTFFDFEKIKSKKIFKGKKELKWKW